MGIAAGSGRDWKVSSQPSVVAVRVELYRALNDATGVHTYAVEGVQCFMERLEQSWQGSPKTTEDSRMTMGVGDPNDPKHRGYQSYTVRETREKGRRGGWFDRQLGQQWIVIVIATWEEEYRERLAQAIGCEKKDVVDAAFADMNQMRNDVVHHRGISGKNNSCLSWFPKHAEINVTTDHVIEFLQMVGAIEAPAP